jgi:hypothetical protein
MKANYCAKLSRIVKKKILYERRSIAFVDKKKPKK